MSCEISMLNAKPAAQRAFNTKSRRHEVITKNYANAYGLFVAGRADSA
jgi:flagellar basal body rod protein FlgB